MKEFIKDKILPKVMKPARYLGSEWNSVHKPWDEGKVRAVFAFPDLYEVGMSHLGTRILYHLVNDQPDYLMERVFAPGVDMEAELRKHRLPLFSLESYRPLADFDVIGFTLQYEMSYTNILNMLELAGIPLKAEDRPSGFPLIIAGGPGSFNPEPLADFFDLFVIGEGEEVILEIFAVIKQAKEEGKFADKAGLLVMLSQIPGVYVPAFFDVSYRHDGKISQIKPNRHGIPAKISKRVIKDLDQAYFPGKPIVPFMEIVHDRIMLEVLRGCMRGCRFCQAGMIYRPVRERSPETLLAQARRLVEETGYDEISLTSLSTSDYTCVEPVLKKLVDTYQDRRVGVSLPSLRVDSFSVNLAKQVQRVRKTGLTFAPEAGSQRLRDVINKGVTEENLMEAVTSAFSSGWHAVKLYFMIGLPTETDTDLDGIADLARKVVEVGKKYTKRVKVTVSASSFVPKPHTPFQWEGQHALPELKRKQEYLKNKLRDRRIVFNWHDAELSFLEAVFSRGDRRLGRSLMRAWERGCKFDSWSEHFKYDEWLAAFAETGIKPEEYANEKFAYDDILPWDHLDTGVTKSFLIKEHQKAMEAAVTGDCRFERCTTCGICQDMDVRLVLKGRGAQ